MRACFARPKCFDSIYYRAQVGDEVEFVLLRRPRNSIIPHQVGVHQMLHCPTVLYVDTAAAQSRVHGCQLQTIDASAASCLLVSDKVSCAAGVPAGAAAAARFAGQAGTAQGRLLAKAARRRPRRSRERRPEPEGAGNGAMGETSARRRGRQRCRSIRHLPTW